MDGSTAEAGFEKFDYDTLAGDEAEARKFCARWMVDSSPAGLLSAVAEAWIERALAAEAENARLRAALQSVLNVGVGEHGLPGVITEVRQIVYKALEAK